MLSLNPIFRVFQPAGSRRLLLILASNNSLLLSVSRIAKDLDEQVHAFLQIPITQTVLKGDLNGNGRVDIGDVSRVAYMAIGLVDEELRGDFSYDGTVKAADAARIAYYYVGKIPAL
jgi:hypothetical protein